jgi:hypothetical protein
MQTHICFETTETKLFYELIEDYYSNVHGAFLNSNFGLKKPKFPYNV